VAEMTRDEHVARAQELLARADHLIDHLDDLVYGDLRPFGTRKADEETAVRFADVATAHLKLAEVLGQKDANEPRPDAWKVVDSAKGVYSKTVHGDVWLLRQFPEGHNDTRHSAGWWVQSVDYPRGCWVGYTDDPNWERQKYADRFLHAWYGECTKDDPMRQGPGWPPCACRECTLSRDAEATQ
jgi:hypothetical protein